MPLRPELIRAYENADYAVFGQPGLVLRIGEPNAALDALLEADGARSATFVTAANPQGKRRGALRNFLAFYFLKSVLKKKRYRHHLGEGRDPAGTWAAERSVLVTGIARADAEALGRRFGQLAIVFAEKGQAPELVLL
jgi:hypothetical protein